MTWTVEYHESGKQLFGFLARDDSRREPRPGILVFRENTGLTDHERDRAACLAQLGYVALACDLFGERVLPGSDAERRAAFEEFRKTKILPRSLAGFEALAAQPQVDKDQIAAIGFCLGGMAALELARSGADLKGVASFHGGLASAQPAAAGQMKAKVLVCHGALDPFIT
jgi:dienelactone hydrolase